MRADKPASGFHHLFWRSAAGLVAGFTTVTLLAMVIGRALPVSPPVVLPLGLGMNLDIYLLEVRRGLAANLTKNDWWDGEPAVSPDGRRVIFASLRDGVAALYVADLETLALRQLTTDAFYNEQAAWSPDGAQLVYASERGGRDLYLIDADGTNGRRLTTTDYPDFAPAWSPDGRQIAYSMAGVGDPGEIYVISADGRTTRRFTYYRGIDVRPAWSPDGRWLAFASDRDGSLNLYMMAADCLEMPDGCEVANPRQLTRGGVNPAALWWSPDGEQILYWERVIGTPEVYALEAGCDIQPGGCRPRQLTNLGRSGVFGGGR